MIRELMVVSDQTGIPVVDVPCDCMWDLMEYLSCQRVAVHYDFRDTHFTVTFPKQSVTSVQQLLDHRAHSDWARGDAEQGAVRSMDMPPEFNRSGTAPDSPENHEKGTSCRP
jgi:hypothetical protein